MKEFQNIRKNTKCYKFVVFFLFSKKEKNADFKEILIFENFQNSIFFSLLKK